ncbi:TraR/DksA family transcriptional regulator [Candidatus Odyssella thessalonicensis]|uniref:TraR/DksA family transcriptional regulator n=1 Tax=Candidatus Odyssella thessalonicensis TaxID=84647 RepID=UPI000225AF96|nr:TraR/DksA family transcriptional regulator [Candidatus Odyssella thessalonicensis]
MEKSFSKEAINLKGYRPELDDSYMSNEMMAYFYSKLVGWKNSLIKSEQSSVDSLADVTTRENDPLDNCSNKEINYPQVACIEHKKMLLRQIDAALASITNGTYGYCEHTGNPIGVARLESYPIARLCVWAQEQLEKVANINSKSSPSARTFY